MTPAEFRIKRRALGLTYQDVAAACDVAERTAQRWESTHEPPADACVWLEEKWTAAASAVDQAMQLAEEMEPEPVTLIAYRRDKDAQARQGMTAREHAALLGHITMLLTLGDFDYQVIDHVGE